MLANLVTRPPYLLSMGALKRGCPTSGDCAKQSLAAFAAVARAIGWRASRDHADEAIGSQILCSNPPQA